MDYSLRVLHTGMGLLTHKFKITHPNVVAVTTATHAFELYVVNIEVVNRVICYRLSQYSSSYSH